MTTPQPHDPPAPALSRRDALKLSALAAGAAGAAALGLAPTARPARAATLAAPPAPTRSLRIAHLTDPHIQPERRAAAGVAACLAHVQALADKPALILTGGDLIMDSFDTGLDRAKLQWDLWLKTFKDHCNLPLHHTLGNHDSWGWNKSKSGTTGSEPGWGKRLAIDTLGLPNSYHSFTQRGWKFIVLDSTFPDGDGYIARLDDQQFEWLTGELAATPPATPVLICSHMPILTATALLTEKPEVSLQRSIPAGFMHVDAKRLVRLFAKHPNVKLCLSGHIHEVDRVDFQGVTYFCDGAVSGSWWKGPNNTCHEGYAVLDLFDDGTFRRDYIPYGWKADPA
ncbi:MAG: metallophosphoesterase family protein [Phycisphaerales bacterium]